MAMRAVLFGRWWSWLYLLQEPLLAWTIANWKHASPHPFPWFLPLASLEHACVALLSRGVLSGACDASEILVLSFHFLSKTVTKGMDRARALDELRVASVIDWVLRFPLAQGFVEYLMQTQALSPHAHILAAPQEYPGTMSLYVGLGLFSFSFPAARRCESRVCASAPTRIFLEAKPHLW